MKIDISIYIQILKNPKILHFILFYFRNIVIRANELSKNAKYISHDGLSMRIDYFLNPADGVLTEEVKVANPMANSAGMMDMMKSNMAMQVPNLIMMGWLSFFFTGFVLVRIPFPLLDRFKGMLQKGIQLEYNNFIYYSGLDVTYVTSLSWYFLVMFGMRGLYPLILGRESGIIINYYFNRR